MLGAFALPSFLGQNQKIIMRRKIIIEIIAFQNAWTLIFNYIIGVTIQQ